MFTRARHVGTKVDTMLISIPKPDGTTQRITYTPCRRHEPHAKRGMVITACADCRVTSTDHERYASPEWEALTDATRSLAEASAQWDAAVRAFTQKYPVCDAPTFVDELANATKEATP